MTMPELNSKIVPITYGKDCYNRVNPALELQYRHWNDGLWRYLAGVFDNYDSPAPTLTVVHSPKAFPDTIASGTGSILAYDQYLGQLFNQLTRLTLIDAEIPRVDSYLLKLYAQRAFIVGQYDCSATYIVMSQLVGHKLPALPSEDRVTMAERAFLTAIQEMFSIAHELVHGLISELPEAAQDLMDAWAAMMREMIEAPGWHYVGDLSGIDEEMDKAREIAWKRRETSRAAKAPDRTSVGPYVGDGTHVESLKRSLLDTITKAHLAEECFCDALASQAVFSLVGGRDQDLVMEGITYSLLNLRIIQHLDRFLSHGGLKGIMDDSNDFYTQSLCRSALMRYFVLGSLEPPERITVSKAIQKVIDRHSRVLGDQLLFCLRLPAFESLSTEYPLIASHIEEFYSGDTAYLKDRLGFPEEGFPFNKAFEKS